MLIDMAYDVDIASMKWGFSMSKMNFSHSHVWLSGGIAAPEICYSDKIGWPKSEEAIGNQ